MTAVRPLLLVCALTARVPANRAADPAAPTISERRLSGTMDSRFISDLSLKQIALWSEAERECAHLPHHRPRQRQVGTIWIHDGSHSALGEHTQPHIAADTTGVL